MTKPTPPSLRSSRALLALACAFGLTLVSLPAAPADTVALQPLADKVLPLTGTFEKVANSEGPPFVLHVKNNSKESVKVSGKVLLAVVHHAMDKARALPEQTIEAGGTWTIKALTADDRVILTSPGYAEIEFRVPFKI